MKLIFEEMDIRKKRKGLLIKENPLPIMFKVHLSIFLMRIFALAYIFISIKSTKDSHEDEKHYAENIITLSRFNLYSFISTTSAVIKHNIFAYDISNVISFHNAIFIVIMTIENQKSTIHFFILVFIISTYILEGLYGFSLRIIKRKEIHHVLFKKLGADPIINSKLN